MQIKILRGCSRIGGTITEISAGKTKILIDYGNPPLGIKACGTKACGGPSAPPDAVIFTHYHGDHAGGLSRLPKDIPVYMGRTAGEIYGLLHPGEEAAKRLIPYENGKAIHIGELSVTPILTDHSAYDAYMLLIEGDGKRVLHTGDFRLHGIRGKQVLPFLEKYRDRVDVLITEGTNLSYEHPVTISEEALGRTAEILMERYPFVFVMTTPDNIDRLAVMHKAAESKEAFLCDRLQMNILKKAAEDAERNCLSCLYRFEHARLLQPEHMPKSFVMAVRDTRELMDLAADYGKTRADQTLMVYSMPKALLKKRREGESLETWLEGFSWKVMLHTSGHAAEWALWLMARTIRPKAVIPVHTENPHGLRLGALQERIVFLEDGEVYPVD